MPVSLGEFRWSSDLVLMSSCEKFTVISILLIEVINICNKFYNLESKLKT